MSNNYFYDYLKQIQDLYGDELIYKNPIEFSKYGMRDSNVLFLIDDLDIDSKISSDVKDLFLKMLSSIHLTTNDISIINYKNFEYSDFENDLVKIINKYNPKLIVLLSNDIFKLHFIRNKKLIKKDSILYKYLEVDFLVTHHPKVLMKEPILKRESWNVFKLIRDRYITCDG